MMLLDVSRGGSYESGVRDGLSAVIACVVVGDVASVDVFIAAPVGREGVARSADG